MGDQKTIPKDEISKHNSESDLWIIVNGKVYDVTKYAPDHPGGPELLLSVAGSDGSEGFNDIGHSEDAHKQMEEFLVGSLEGAEQVTAQNSSESAAPSKPTVSPPSDFSRWMSVLMVVAVLMIVLALIPIDSVALELARLDDRSRSEQFASRMGLKL